jgi:hypothetical protein
VEQRHHAGHLPERRSTGPTHHSEYRRGHDPHDAAQLRSAGHDDSYGARVVRPRALALAGPSLNHGHFGYRLPHLDQMAVSSIGYPEPAEKCAGDDDAWGRSSRGRGDAVDAPPAEGGGVVGGGDGKEKISELEEWAKKLEVRLRRRGTKGIAFGLVRC